MCETLPNDWKKTALKNVGNIRFSGVDKKSKPGERKVKLCNYIDVYNNEYITREIPFMEATASISEIETFSVSEGDVIITKDSETPFDIGVASVVSEPLENVICGYHLAHIKPKLDEIDPNFLAKQLRNDRIVRYFSQQANGVTRYGLSTAAIENISIWLPSTLDEQKTISKVMRNIDSIIKHTKAKIDKLGKIKIGLMQDLLTKGIDENGQIRDPEKHPEQFQDSPLGLIPMEWEHRRVSQISETYSGGTPSRSMSSFFGGSIPWVKSGEVNLLEITKTEETITEKAFFSSAVKWVEPMTPLIALYGATAGVVSWLAIKATTNQAILAMPPQNRTETDARWFYWSLIFRSRAIIKTVQGSGQPNLSKEIIDSTYIGYPLSISEQVEIRGRLDTLLRQIGSELLLLKKMKLLKQGLMQDLLTGRVPVPKEMIKEGADL